MAVNCAAGSYLVGAPLEHHLAHDRSTEEPNRDKTERIEYDLYRTVGDDQERCGERHSCLKLAPKVCRTKSAMETAKCGVTSSNLPDDDVRPDTVVPRSHANKPLANSRVGTPVETRLFDESCSPCHETSGEVSSDDSGSDEVFTDDGAPTDLNNNISPNSVSGYRRAGKRKQVTPQRSAERGDPKFQGVTLQLRTCLEKNSSQLCITAYFNCRKLSPRSRLPWRPSSLGSGGEGQACAEPHPEVFSKPRRQTQQNWGSSGKQCASCSTRKTPLWRDAEDGTPLCNACGIRYKKYRIRCLHCWHIPKKETKADVTCANCGEQLRISVFRYKPL